MIYALTKTPGLEGLRQTIEEEVNTRFSYFNLDLMNRSGIKRKFAPPVHDHNHVIEVNITNRFEAALHCTNSSIGLDLEMFR